MTPKVPWTWWVCTKQAWMWCALDILTRCKIKAICDKHDRAITEPEDYT